MKLLSNETWDKYQELKARDWKQTEKIKREDMAMQRSFQEHCHRCRISSESRMQLLTVSTDNDIKLLKIHIKEQRKEITKQHIDIDKLQKLLKRKK